ncbi:MAG: rhodanese-like domain-containing protein [Bacteriovoracia bacterium]
MLSPWLISPEQLKQERAQVTLVDVRQPEEFEEVHIDGARLIPLGELAERATELSKDQNIVLYCAKGVRSLEALMTLRTLGFPKLRSLDGGIAAWLENA